MDWRRALTTGGIVVAVLLLVTVTRLSQLLTDFWWFQSLGFEEIFTTMFMSKVVLFILGAVAFFLFSLLNIQIAAYYRKNRKQGSAYLTVASVLLSLIMGLYASGMWLTVQKFLKQVPFNLTDPIFSMDIGFYIMSLPFFEFLWQFTFVTVLLTLILVLLAYFQSAIGQVLAAANASDSGDGYNEPKNITPQVLLNALRKKALGHLSLLGGLFFVLLAAQHYLARFSVLFSEKGLITGATYTDVNVLIPVFNLLVILALLVALMFFIQPVKNFKPKTITYVLITYLAISFIGLSLLPGLVQEVRVSPNELQLEEEYIEHNINFTRSAYGLEDVHERTFNATEPLTRSAVDNAPETINNVRIQDVRPLVKTYQQTQEIRLYYDISSIGIDRYNISGEYTQVFIGPRELDQSKISEKAQTWVNRHLVYTHGYGLVMSPVNKVTESGLPQYYIKDVPPQYTVNESDIYIEQPRLYYGEQSGNYVVVNTSVEEFDYPKGSNNAYTHYDGPGGVPLPSVFSEALMALRFTDLRLLLSGDIKEGSRIMFARNIKERVKKLTPFISLDGDPYLTIHDGRLAWILDGYVTSDRFPYAESTARRFNYIRNSLKITVDAYSGEVTYYRVNNSDPLMDTYENLFPESFTTISKMPEDLKRHIRYPSDIFRVQSRMFKDYHMEDPTVFYNKEDAWEIPTEMYGTGQQVKVEPYYNIMKLPRTEQEEFTLLTSFTPIRKDNMVGWLAGRSDDEHYGELMLYRFPKDTLIYGPQQIEAQFDQDTGISERISLWSQRGSRVTRGNLLVIPMGSSVLYVEPLYLHAETGQLPQLKRVLLSDGERVVMAETFDQALLALLGESEKADPSAKGPQLSVQKAQEAREYYQQLIEASSNNNWSAFGENLDKLGETLTHIAQNGTG